MATIPVVQEGSTSYHDFTITYAVGAGPPDSVRYRLMASATDEIIAWTALGSPSTTSIEIPASANTDNGTGLNRYLTIEITHNTSRKITVEEVYKLADLKGVAA